MTNVISQRYLTHVALGSRRWKTFMTLLRSFERKRHMPLSFSLDADSALEADFTKIMGAIDVVDNNGPSSIGGGGTLLLSQLRNVKTKMHRRYFTHTSGHYPGSS